MSRLKPIVPYLLAILAGVLTALPLNVNYTSIILNITVVPLLFAEHMVAHSNHKHKMLETATLGFLFMYFYQWFSEYPLKLQFSYWMYLYFFGISLFFVLSFILFAFVKKKLGDKWGYVAFVCFYLCFEYFLLEMQIFFPVIMLGNSLVGLSGFGIHYMQWYEYTGVLGGTLWILVCNVLFFLLIRNKIEKQKARPALLFSALATFVLPLAVSLIIFATYKEKKAPVEFVLVQPNYNPYTEKFTTPMNEQRDRMVNLAESAITDHTDFVVFPETALDDNIWYNNMNEENVMVQYLRDSLLEKHEGLKLLSGVLMLQYFITSVPPSIDAIPAAENIFIQKYNAAALVKGESVEAYKKNILVPFSERMPFGSVFRFLKKYKKNEPGTFFFSFAEGEEQNVLKSAKANIGCFICYESIFGAYCAGYAEKGADLLCTISNDGWWLKSNFTRTHLCASRIRAIENRRSLVRCANTGITAGIDQRGRIVAQAPWWEPTALKVTLNKNKTKTLYTQWGDYIGLISALFVLFIICLMIYKRITRTTSTNQPASRRITH